MPKVSNLAGAFCALALASLAFVGAPAAAQPPGVTYAPAERASDDVPIALYKQRRARLLASMSERSIAVFFAAEPRVRQNDVDYEYRQSSDLLYLCGINEPQTALLLIPGGIALEGDSSEIMTELLFVRRNNPQEALWSGAFCGATETERRYGIRALDYERFFEVTRSLLAERDTLFATALPTDSATIPLTGEKISLRQKLKERLAAIKPGLALRSQARLLAAMRQIKDTAELRLLRKAIDITVRGHRRAMEAVLGGMAEYECEALIEGEFKRLGAEDVGYASIVGSGANACVLHYVRNRRVMRAGELTLMDCGAEYHGYSADVTRTVPVGGKFSPEQKAIYDLVYAAQTAAIAESKPGADRRRPHSRAVEIIRKGLLDLGVIAEPEQYKWYFPHGSSHHIGLDVHDATNDAPLQAGMVLTVEPGVYIPPGSPCDKKWHGIGVRIEDDALVTEGEPEILSAALPRRSEDVEALMAQAASKTSAQTSEPPPSKPAEKKEKKKRR